MGPWAPQTRYPKALICIFVFFHCMMMCSVSFICDRVQVQCNKHTFSTLHSMPTHADVLWPSFIVPITCINPPYNYPWHTPTPRGKWFVTQLCWFTAPLEVLGKVTGWSRHPVYQWTTALYIYILNIYIIISYRYHYMNSILQILWKQRRLVYSHCMSDPGAIAKL